jgi:hypothetical protein
MWMIPFN